MASQLGASAGAGRDAGWEVLDADREHETRRPTPSPAPERPMRSTAAPPVAPAAAGTSGPPGDVRRQPRAYVALRDAFASRRALRQAILLHEILGLPKALQQPTGGIAASSHGQAAP